MQEYSINRSLDGANVLLTGVTGFVGSTLLERILRLDPGPEKIFVVVREKRGIDPRCRLSKLSESPLFENVDKNSLKKVEVISGDLTMEGLGLSDENRDLLLSTCTHIFHSAASISFAGQLASAVKINLHGTRQVLRFAQKMANLRAMVHVSTAYVNCTRNKERILEEKVYPSRFDPVEFTDMIEKMSPDEIQRRSKEFLGEHSNTYTFTKNMAESLLQAERQEVPLSIVRPSIVLSSWKEPVSGWIDNVNNGACGFIAGVARGIFRTFLAKPDARLDIIPVDMVVSTILAASVHATNNPKEMTIFHCTSSHANSPTWGEYCREVVKNCRKHPLRLMGWYPAARPRESPIRNAAVFYIFHLLPAYFLTLLWQIGRPGRRHVLLAVQQKFAKADTYTSFFAVREWSFSRQNMQRLAKGLAENERDLHPMDPSEIEWNRYFEICVLGLRRYFHKEGSTTSYKAKRLLRWLRIMAIVIPIIRFVFFWYILNNFVPVFCSTTNALISGFFVLFLFWL